MEPSPLTRQPPPETFRPKIELLYASLFTLDPENAEDAIEKSVGFWSELFLLPPKPTSLNKTIARLSADDLMADRANTQNLFLQAIAKIKAGVGVADENALHRLTVQTLTVVLGGVLSKKYTNPSSDIISVLAGLDNADAVFSDFVATLDVAIRGTQNVKSNRPSLQAKAVRAALAMVSGAYQTGLVSYFIHRDLFPSLMKLIQDSGSDARVMEPFILLGLLTNYNKFEFQNPYRLRLDDFVNDVVIRDIAYSISWACCTVRDQYVAVQDDQLEGWNLGNTLNYIGLGALAPAGSRPTTPNAHGEEALDQFATLWVDPAMVVLAKQFANGKRSPAPEAAILLSTYDFVNSNKVFCFNFVSLDAEEKGGTSPFSALLSLTSYLFQHAHRSARASLYTYLALFTLRILVEDAVILKRLCSEESNMNVRLCRQRQPFLPLFKGERVAVVFVMEIMIDGLNHNLRKRLDVDLYLQFVGILIRIISHLSRARTRLTYHWSELWRSLLSFIRFLTVYASDLSTLPDVRTLANRTSNLIALSLSTGEIFLPDTAAYDDLFYKLVEAGDILVRFRDAYDLSSPPANSSATNKTTGPGKASSLLPSNPPASSVLSPAGGLASSTDTLVTVSEHYRALLADEGGKGFSQRRMSSKEVSRIITQGYETLSIQAKDGLDHWERYREADHKAVMKKVARVAVGDARALVKKRAGVSKRETA